MHLKLSKPQTTVFDHPARFKVIVAGRRFGKSYLALAEMLWQALGFERQDILYMAPTRQQAKDILWRDIKDFSRPYLASAPIETELRLNYINGSSIHLMGGEAYDRARGPGYDLAVLDEFADFKPEAWYEVIRPALADRQRAR